MSQWTTQRHHPHHVPWPPGHKKYISENWPLFLCFKQVADEAHDSASGSAPSAQAQFVWPRDYNSPAYYLPSAPTSPPPIFLSLLALSKGWAGNENTSKSRSFIANTWSKRCFCVWSERRVKLLAKTRSEGCWNLIYPDIFLFPIILSVYTLVV